MKSITTHSPEDWGKLVFGLSVFLGLIIRIFPGLLVGFPLNDGGMLLIMMRDLRANGFVIPAFTTYNNAHIPFAYPPFGFYVGGLLSAIGISEIGILRWLPVIVNVISIFAFYLLAKKLLANIPRSVLATAFYILTPGSYGWQIMGGGLTRSFGKLFLIWAVYALLQMFAEGKWKYIFLAVLFCSLAVLSHPEITVAALTGCALVWAFFGRTWKNTLLAFYVALGTFLLTSPWWGSVIAYHGLTPFLTVFYSGEYHLPPWKGLYDDFFAPVNWLTIVGLFQVIGFFWAIYERNFFPIVWMVMPYVFEPRSASELAFLPACILAAVAFADALPFLWQGFPRKSRSQPAEPDELTQNKPMTLSLFAILFYLFILGALYDFRLMNTSLRIPDALNAMQWVKKNVPANSQFLILTGNEAPMNDPIQEWFPALAERHSQTTLQGLEWTLADQFFPRLGRLAELQTCKSVRCVENWSTENDMPYAYILIEKSRGMTVDLLDSFDDSQYPVVYENLDYTVFSK